MQKKIVTAAAMASLLGISLTQAAWADTTDAIARDRAR